jgi:hypothetical protein
MRSLSDATQTNHYLIGELYTFIKSFLILFILIILTEFIFKYFIK